MKESSLEKALIENNVITEDKLRKARFIQEETNKPLSDILVEEGFVKESDLILLISRELGIPTLNLKIFKADKGIINLVPKKIALMYHVVPLAKVGNSLTVAMYDPENLVCIDDLKQLTGCDIIPILTTQKDVDEAVEVYYNENKDIEDIFDDIGEAEDSSLEVIDDTFDDEEYHEAVDTPIVRMVNAILNNALKSRASDIHFEPYEKKFRVRFRVDGLLQEYVSLPKKVEGQVIARLKILSNMNITEKRVPQDGRFRVKMGVKEVDFRVSILPTVFGEKAVLRVLDKSNLSVGLEKLGFLPDNLKKLEEAIKKPYGLILVTGPTGSGKSTTLYSILNKLNTPNRNIMTIEDPVEYQVTGITQTQTLPEVGLTFAAGLRSLLRQSPDVILVGEIRDGETADIAVKSSLTGHLVFSTLHTNSACGAITRLADMGVEPFLISSSLLLSAAQRLCKKICENCKEEYKIPEEVLLDLNIPSDMLEGVMSYRGKGCDVCKGSGYYGRLGTLEILTLDDEIRRLILDNASSDEIEKLARSKGMTTLFENAFKKFKMGLTTLEEVFRISSNE